MANQQVNLLIRIRTSDGKRSYKNPVFTGNGRLKPLYAEVEDRREHHPEGVRPRYVKQIGEQLLPVRRVYLWARFGACFLCGPEDLLVCDDLALPRGLMRHQ